MTKSSKSGELEHQKQNGETIKDIWPESKEIDIIKDYTLTREQDQILAERKTKRMSLMKIFYDQKSTTNERA